MHHFKQANLRDWHRIQSVFVILLLCGLQTSCTMVDRGFLSPAGPIAESLRNQFFIILGLLLIVALPVFVALPFILWRYRAGGRGDYRPEWSFSLGIEVLIWGVPVLVVCLLGYNLAKATMATDPYAPLGQAGPPLEIDVVGLDWKWLFLYPDENIASVNRLVLPRNRPVHFKLTSGTVLQSFMIPKLGSQIYAMPGMVTELWLAGSKVDTYTGLNTQFNGTGFQAQHFSVSVVDEPSFDDWSSKASDAPALDASVLTSLTAPSTLPEPQLYGGFDEGLFKRLSGIDRHENQMAADPSKGHDASEMAGAASEKP